MHTISEKIAPTCLDDAYNTIEMWVEISSFSTYEKMLLCARIIFLVSFFKGRSQGRNESTGSQRHDVIFFSFFKAKFTEPPQITSDRTQENTRTNWIKKN